MAQPYYQNQLPRQHVRKSTPELLSGMIRRDVASFQHSLRWNKYVPRVVCVLYHRVYCEQVCRTLSNSPTGRQRLYLSLLSAISNNARRHFNWLLRKTMDVLSRDEIESTAEMWYPMQEDIDMAPFSSTQAFCSSSRFNKNDMIVSLLHYAVLCCSRGIVVDLIGMVQGVSKSSEEWYPFLPYTLSSTPLWFAALQCQPSIISDLLNAGASPYEVCKVQNGIGPDMDITLYPMCTRQQPIRSALQNLSIESGRFTVPPALETCVIARRSVWIVAFLKATLRWNSDMARVCLPAVLDLMLSEQSGSFLSIPCHSEEDIVHKQAVCVGMLYEIISQWRSNMFLLEGAQPATIVRDLVKHGANACGFMTLASTKKFIARYRKIVLRQSREVAFYQRSTAHSDIPSCCEFRVILAGCARFRFQGLPASFPSAYDVAYPAGRSWTPQVTFAMPFFWTGLYKTRSLDNPIIRELFHCGALPHVKSLESVPFSASDRRLHNGPTCRCEGVELSAQQRAMSITDLILPPNLVQSLQASCRATIIHSCQWHGVDPAIRKLPLPPNVIEYLLYNCRK